MFCFRYLDAVIMRLLIYMPGLKRLSLPYVSQIITSISCNVLVGEFIVSFWQRTILILPHIDRSQENNERILMSCCQLPLQAVNSIKDFYVSPVGLVQCACLPAFSMTWMEEGQAWLHLPLPVFHGTPQTSLSFICQQQPVIRIPLPAGPNAQESRCGSLRQQAD